MSEIVDFPLFEKKLFSLLNSSDSKEIAVAVSGGADSLCLALLTDQFCQKNKYHFHAVTVDHGLRPESAQEAQKVHLFFEKRHLDHQILTWHHDTITSAVEEQARNHRYQLLFHYCKENHIQFLLLAHQKEDCVETFLSRLKKGSGLKGLSSISEKTTRNGITLLRPLLFASKEDLKETLKAQHIDWIEDPTNETGNSERTKLRENRSLFEKMGFSYDLIFKSISKIQESESYIEKKVENLIRQSVVFDEKGYAFVPVSDFQNFDNEEKIRLLSSVILTIGKNIYPPKRERLSQFIQNYHRITIGKCVLSKYKNNIFISKEISRMPSPMKIHAGEHFTWDRFTGTAQTDMVISPLKKSVIRHIPAIVQKSWPAFYRENTLLFVPSLDYLEEKCHLKEKLHFIKDTL